MEFYKLNIAAISIMPYLADTCETEVNLIRVYLSRPFAFTAAGMAISIISPVTGIINRLIFSSRHTHAITAQSPSAVLFFQLPLQQFAGARLGQFSYGPEFLRDLERREALE